MQRLLALPLLLALALTLLAPRPAAAHTRLERSTPAAGDTARGEVREIRLRFSRAAEPRFTGIELVGPGGPVPAGEANEVRGSERREYVFTLAAPLAPGAYTVRWRTAGRDGHPLRGTFAFTVAASAADPANAAIVPPVPGPPSADTAPPPAPPVDHGAHAADEPTVAAPVTETTSTDSAPFPTTVRWLGYLGLLGMVGAAAFRLLVLPALNGTADGLRDAVAARARGLGMGAALLFLLALPIRLWLQSSALLAPGDAWNGGHLRDLLGATPWGAGWLLGVTGAVLALAGFLAARRGWGWHLAALGAVAAAFSPALMGHAAGVEGIPALAIAADGLHVLGAAAWMGGLAVLLLAGIPAALRASEGAMPALALLVRRFSPVALAAAGLAAATGTVSALFHLHGVAQLWTTGYGQALLAKLALLATVAALGFFNWRHVVPALGTDASTRTLRRSATVELAMGVLVVLVTAILVALPTPS